MASEVDQTARQWDGQHPVDSRSWVLKSGSKWLGYDPLAQAYFEDPIFFGGDLNFERNFESLVISDSQSHSIYLIWSIRNCMEKGISMGLTNSDWIQAFLILAKKYLPLIFTSLSRHSSNLNALFIELVSNINLENEIAKLRSAFWTISRKTSEQVHISVFRIKSLYLMILSINSPHFTDDKLQIRADYLALSCIPHLVTANTNSAFQVFIQIKSQECEMCGCTEGCNFLSSQEHVSSDYQYTILTFKVLRLIL